MSELLTIEDLMAQFAHQTHYVAEHELHEMDSPALVAFIEENKLGRWEGFAEFVEMFDYRIDPFTFLGNPVSHEAFWGGEGDGAEFCHVLGWNDRHFRFCGWYSSWDSNQWSDKVVEVSPIQVSVTRYVELDKA